MAISQNYADLADQILDIHGRLGNIQVEIIQFQQNVENQPVPAAYKTQMNATKFKMAQAEASAETLMRLIA